MLIKFETKSARVKGLAFHPKRRWLLAALHNGVIQLWDYSEKTLIDKFDEHKGPVRGVDFHQHQPLFVSGGDDAKIKVWNYKTRRCIFTLDAHEDYIRTVYFHHEHPWIVSASDDQSVRIWNWQSRTRIALLTGHTHYVMCAQFHPTSELILSASVDQTLRLWDVTGLKMKGTSSSHPREEISSGLPEILSKTDYSVESKIAHDSELNWCAFHPDPSRGLCLSAADDFRIKLWKVDSRNMLREIETFRGHNGNVGSATFHPRKDFILSVSEDRSIRIWDLEKKTPVLSHRRDIDRFWAVVAHPKENLFAAGHDSGIMVFKLERERPAYAVSNDFIIYTKNNQLWCFNMKTQERARKLLNLKPKTEICYTFPRLHCYSFDERQTNQVVISVRGGVYNKSVVDLYQIPNGIADNVEPIREPGKTAVFIGPNRYAILLESGKVVFKVNGKESKSKKPLMADDIFEAGAGRLFVKVKDKGVTTLALYDIEKALEVNTIKLDPKNVIISDNKKYIACICSTKVVICDGSLNVLSTITDQRKIKSAVWHETGVLIYSTPVHVKYALTDGDTTTIISVPQTVYIMGVRGDKLFCIERNGTFRHIPVDPREFKFKQAAIRNERGAILAALRQLGNLTRAEISFLVKRGHPGLALKFVSDHQTRFPLALQAYDIDAALESVLKINTKRCWEQLAEVAIQVGHIQAVETAYKHLNKPHSLAMLYLVSDQRDKMLEARQRARELGDTSTEFIISLLCKDFAGCTQIIRRCGHPNLAYTCAVNHGLEDLAQEISQELSEKQLSQLAPLADSRTGSTWEQTSIPTIGNSPLENWPLLNDEQDNIEDVLAADAADSELELGEDGDWEDSEIKDQLSEPERDLKDDEPMEELIDAEEDGWENELEDLVDDDVEADAPVIEDRPQFKAPNEGQNIMSKWTQVSDLPLHHVLASSYKTAIGFLKSQVGLKNAEPLKDIFKDLTLQSRLAYRGIGLLPTLYVYPSVESEYEGETAMPSGGYRIEDLEKKLNDCYSLFSSGKFADAIEKFRTLLLTCLFLQIYTTETDTSVSEQEKRAKDIISISKEYIIGLLVWLERKNITGKDFADHKRACELAAYFAKLNLSKHRGKVLEKAFEVFLVKPKEFQKTRAAVSIARRLLDYISTDDPKKAKMVAYAERVKSSYDVQVDQQVSLDYDDQNPYSLCAASFKPIYGINEPLKCPLCDARYSTEYNGQVCRICQVSEIGATCSGIQFKMTGFE